MLNAIFESKSGRLSREADQNIRWRDLFKGSEDLVTSTIFERLSYLSSGTAWQLLTLAAGGRLQHYRLAELNSIVFWPLWSTEDRARGVEPDVFIEFDLGDPTKKVHVIVEAKHDGAQTASQLTAEVRAWSEAVDAGDLEQPDQLVVLAIGGLPVENKIKNLQKAFAQSVSEMKTPAEGIILAMVGWRDIARAVTVHAPRNTHEARIVGDMIQALELFGYYHIIKPDHLERLVSHRPVDRKLTALLMHLNTKAMEALTA